MSRLRQGTGLNTGLYALMRASDWHILTYTEHLNAIGTRFNYPLQRLYSCCSYSAPVAIAHLHRTRDSVMLATRPDVWPKSRASDGVGEQKVAALPSCLDATIKRHRSPPTCFRRHHRPLLDFLCSNNTFLGFKANNSTSHR